MFFRREVRATPLEPKNVSKVPAKRIIYDPQNVCVGFLCADDLSPNPFYTLYRKRGRNKIRNIDLNPKVWSILNFVVQFWTRQVNSSGSWPFVRAAIIVLLLEKPQTTGWGRRRWRRGGTLPGTVFRVRYNFRKLPH